MVLVNIPAILQKLTKGADLIPAWGDNVAEIIESVDRLHTGIKDRICGPDGRVRRFVSVYVNDENILNLNKEQTSVKAGDEIFIVPAMAGG